MGQKTWKYVFFHFHFFHLFKLFLCTINDPEHQNAPARWIGGNKTHESDSYVWKIWRFWPKNRQKSGLLPLHSNWQLMAMVFDPNFGKNMNNWYITNKRNVASLRQTPNFLIMRLFKNPKLGKKVDFFHYISIGRK